MKHSHVIEAKTGFAFKVQQGQTVRVIDLEGEQVADFIAYRANDVTERLDPSVTLDALKKYTIGEGDTLYTNKYRPMFTITRDMVQVHDLFNSSCRPEMYEFLYGKTAHRSCYENLNQSIAKFAIPQPDQHYAFNIFMHTAPQSDGQLVVKRPLSKAGDFIDLKAEMDCIVAISACPCEESSVNGYHCTPIGVELLEV